MILSVPPLAAALDDIKARRGPAHKVLLSPRGRPLDQDKVRKLSEIPRLVLVCGRYEGFDERIGTVLCDEELSIGDYVLAGGELAAAVVIEAVARLLPGVLGSGLSVADESFSDGRLEYPQWTRPLEFRGHVVPSILLSGDHEGYRPVATARGPAPYAGCASRPRRPPPPDSGRPRLDRP